MHCTLALIFQNSIKCIPVCAIRPNAEKNPNTWKKWDQYYYENSTLQNKLVFIRDLKFDWNSLVDMRHFCDTYILHIFCNTQCYVHYSIPGDVLWNNERRLLNGKTIIIFFDHYRKNVVNVTICKVEKSKKVYYLSLKNTAWKMSKYGVFSGPYYPVFGINTGKYGPEKAPYLNTFHAVKNKLNALNSKPRLTISLCKMLISL